MNILRATLVLSVASLLVGGCSSIKDRVITDANKSTILTEIKDSHDLTYEEASMLNASVIRRGMAAAFSGQKSDPLPVGKTLGQIIDEQKQINANAQIKERDDKVAQEKAEAEDQAARKMMLDALSVTVYEKGFHASDPMNGDYEDNITLKVQYKNCGNKPIRAFKGRVRFADVFGDVIAEPQLKEDDPLSVGEVRKVGLSIKYNKFMDADQKLRSTSLQNLNIEWKPQELLFDDGTSMSLASGS